MLGRSAAAGAIVWTAPVIDSMASAAAAASGPPLPRLCVVAASTIPANQTACTKVAVGAGTKVGQTFDLNATFRNDAKTGATCSCCEYRQFIRGGFSYNGRPVVLQLPNRGGGAPLTLAPRPNGAYHEDGLVSPKGTDNAHYGHRDEGSADAADMYTPAPRATGCTYAGNDFPGLTAGGGKAYVVGLDFRGQIIDVCNANKVIVTRDWSVDCSGASL